MSDGEVERRTDRRRQEEIERWKRSRKEERQMKGAMKWWKGGRGKERWTEDENRLKSQGGVATTEEEKERDAPGGMGGV